MNELCPKCRYIENTNSASHIGHLRQENVSTDTSVQWPDGTPYRGRDDGYGADVGFAEPAPELSTTYTLYKCPDCGTRWEVIQDHETGYKGTYINKVTT